MLCFHTFSAKEFIQILKNEIISESFESLKIRSSIHYNVVLPITFREIFTNSGLLLCPNAYPLKCSIFLKFTLSFHSFHGKFGSTDVTNISIDFTENLCLFECQNLLGDQRSRFQIYSKTIFKCSGQLLLLFHVQLYHFAKVFILEAKFELPPACRGCGLIDGKFWTSNDGQLFARTGPKQWRNLSFDLRRLLASNDGEIWAQTMGKFSDGLEFLFASQIAVGFFFIHGKMDSFWILKFLREM